MGFTLKLNIPDNLNFQHHASKTFASSKNKGFPNRNISKFIQ